jgi:hypothetical protein
MHGPAPTPTHLSSGVSLARIDGTSLPDTWKLDRFVRRQELHVRSMLIVAAAVASLTAGGCESIGSPKEAAREACLTEKFSGWDQPVEEDDSRYAEGRRYDWGIDDAEGGTVHMYDSSTSAKQAFERQRGGNADAYLAGRFVYTAKSYANPRAVACLEPIDTAALAPATP